MSLLIEQLSVPASNALHATAAMARRRNLPAPTSSDLLLALLGQPDFDAVHALQMSGVDPVALRKALVDIIGSRQIIAWSAGGSATPEQGFSMLLAEALAAAKAEGAAYITTRDLLLAALRNPAPEMHEVADLQRIDLEALRRLPVQVYETQASATPPPKARPDRRHFTVSPIFLGLLALLVGAGAYTYLAPTPAPIAVFVFVTAGWIVSLALHEFGHALAAYFGGDDSVVEQGYLTLNPLLYTNPVTSIIIPTFILIMGGIALPGGAVYINRGAIRTRGGMSMVSAAGPLANIVCAGLLAIPFALVRDVNVYLDHEAFWSAMGLLVFMQVSAILLNLIPIPGLDGFGILMPWLPGNVLQMVLPFYSMGPFLLLALFWFSEPFQEVFWTATFRVVTDLQISPYFVQRGFEMFRFWT